MRSLSTYTLGLTIWLIWSFGLSAGSLEAKSAESHNVTLIIPSKVGYMSTNSTIVIQESDDFNVESTTPQLLGFNEAAIAILLQKLSSNGQDIRSISDLHQFDPAMGAHVFGKAIYNYRGKAIIGSINLESRINTGRSFVAVLTFTLTDL
jgi:hypothetical protein